MHTKISQKTRHWQGMASTYLLVAAWLYANISSLELLLKSFIQASSFNQVAIGFAIALVLVQVVRHRQEIENFASLHVSTTPVLRPYPLVLVLGSALSAIALQWLADIEYIGLLLFALGTYGLWGLFVAPKPWYKGLPVAILVACILPFSSPVSSGLGLPARIFTARAVEQMLSAWHVAAISSQDIIVLENGIAHVDSPCSGLKSLWTGTLFLLAVTWLEGRLLGARWLLVWATNLVLLISVNTVRVLLLVALVYVLKQPEIGAVLHLPLGLLGFICTCALTWAMLQRVPKRSDFRLRDTAEHPESIAAPAKQPKSIKSNQQLNHPKSILLVVFIIALALIAQLRPPPEKPLSIAALQWPQQIASDRISLTAAERGSFDNDRTATPEKRRFVFGNLSGSILLVSSTSWGTHHAPELCLVGNGFKVDRIERKQLAPDVLARWLSLQDGKLSATYWLQSSQQTTDDFFSRIWIDITRRQKTWVLVSVLFDSSYRSDNPEIGAFATTIHDVINHSFREANRGSGKNFSTFNHS